MENDFDALRREATKLERHLEDRVARYQQLAQRLSSPSTTVSSGTSSSTSTTTTDQLWSQVESGSHLHNHPTEEENLLRSDIQRTLSALSDLISTRLSPAAERSGKSQHVLLVKRYREILFDLTGDFQKTQATLQRKREQYELFAKANTTTTGGNNSNETDPAMEHLLRERQSIQNSMNASTMVLEQASDIHSDLRSQGASLRSAKTTMARIAHNIPGLNQVMEAIHRKRSRDDKIVAGVIGTCIVFTLWYLFG